MSAIFEDNVPFIRIRCLDCKHYIGDFQCKAFNNIPDEVIFGENNHSKIIAGQKGDYIFEIVNNPRFFKK